MVYTEALKTSAMTCWIALLTEAPPVTRIRVSSVRLKPSFSA